MNFAEERLRRGVVDTWRCLSGLCPSAAAASLARVTKSFTEDHRKSLPSFIVSA